MKPDNTKFLERIWMQPELSNINHKLRLKFEVEVLREINYFFIHDIPKSLSGLSGQ